MPKSWLMKTEPDTFSIADLERVKIEPWSGVRSVFARFHMRAMSVGDDVLFYHSSCEPPGVAGRARVVRTGVIDETQFDPSSPYFDERATREKPIWDCVDVEYVTTFPHYVSLPRIKAERGLQQMTLLKIGRLSVMPVEPNHFARIVELGQIEPAPIAKRAKAATRKTAKAKTAKAKTTKARATAKAAKTKRRR